MLTVDFLELLGRFLRVFLLVEKEQPLVIEPVRRLVGRNIVLFEEIKAAASAKAEREQRHGQSAAQATASGARKSPPVVLNAIVRPQLHARLVSLPPTRPRRPSVPTRADVNEKTRVRQAITQDIRPGLRRRLSRKFQRFQAISGP